MQFFSSINAKLILAPGCQNLLTRFSKWQLSAEVEEGARLRIVCMHRSNRSFPCPTFFGNQCTSIQLSQPLIGFILPFAIWCSSSSFLVVFAFSTIMDVCCQFHDETLFITTLHFVKAKIAVDLKRFLYFKINF